MIRSLKNFFSRRSTANLSNDKRPVSAPTIASFRSTARGEVEPREGRREPPPAHRDPPSRRGLLNQPVHITVNSDSVTVDPLERDLFDGEQVVWICSEPAWETRFDQAASGTPFEEEVFGPGLTPVLDGAALIDDLPQVELTEISGSVREDVLEGDYSYAVQVSGFSPLMARVKIIRGGRP